MKIKRLKTENNALDMKAGEVKVTWVQQWLFTFKRGPNGLETAHSDRNVAAPFMQTIHCIVISDKQKITLLSFHLK